MKAELIEEIQKQFTEENGNDPVPDHKVVHRVNRNNGFRVFDAGCVACQSIQNMNVLKQKYGLMTVQLYDGKVRRFDGTFARARETEVIESEKRKNAKRFAVALLGGKHGKHYRRRRTN